MSHIANFDPEVARPSDWARMYRSLGFQVVPAMMPQENSHSWKRPALSSWRGLEHQLVADSTFESWYGGDGQHSIRTNMGMICGACSGRIFVIDVDLHKNELARYWLPEMRNRQVRAGELETVEQQTGGGGLQLLFRAPIGWLPPTCKTPLGIDIRGQGGFAMLPPSMHESGQPYAWKSGREPWNIEIADAPLWLCKEIDALAGQTPSRSASLDQTVSLPSEQALDAFGNIINGREGYATRLIWAAIVSEYRECPIKPVLDHSNELMKRAYDVYEQNVKSRLIDPSSSKSALLECEGRGISMFEEKWNYAMAQWDSKISEHAKACPSQSKELLSAERPHLSNARSPYFKGYPANEAKPNLSQRWLIKGILPQKGLAIIYGAPGSGKSFFVADLVAHISAPHITDWRDRKAATGGVAYCFLEGGFGAANRITALKTRLGDLGHFVSYPESMNLSSAPRLQQEARSAADCDAKKLVASIQKEQGQVAVVVVDTFSRAMSGKDENSSTEMTAFISAMDYLSKELDCLVVVVHHSGKDQSRGARGHSSLLGAIDTEIEITRPSKELPGRIAKLTKMKEGGDGSEFAFELEQVVLGTDEDGDAVTTCVVVPAELEPTRTKTKPLGHNEKAVLAAYETFQADAPDKYTPRGTGYPDKPERCVDLQAFKAFAAGRFPDTGKSITRQLRDAINSLTGRGVLAINGGVIWRVR